MNSRFEENGATSKTHCRLVTFYQEGELTLPPNTGRNFSRTFSEEVSFASFLILGFL
ncbi:unnamed protein product [Prunus brigantina]